MQALEKTFVVAVDFWPPSLHALETAATLADLLGARLIVVHVYEPGNHYPEQYAIDYDTLHEDLEAAMGDLVAPLRRQGLEVEVEIREGNAKRQLAESVHQHHADLLFVGLHEGRIIEDIFVGENTLHLVKHCEVPVMVVNNSHRALRLETLAIPYDIEEGIGDSIRVLQDLRLPGLRAAKLLIGMQPDRDEEGVMAGANVAADRLQALGIKDIELLVGQDPDPHHAIVEMLHLAAGTYDLVVLEQPDKSARGEFTIGSLVEDVVTKGRMPVLCAPRRQER